jgi:Zn-dependent protease with chaperone function
MSFQADYFDGLSARHKPVLVRVAEHVKNISFDVDGETLIFDLVDLEVQAKLGASRRLIDLPNGGRLEAQDISELEASISSNTSAFWRGLHYLENHLGWVLVSLITTVFAGWMFLQFVVPMLAEYVAKATPPAMEAKLGEQALEGLDSKYGYFSPSKVEQKRKESISVALKMLCLAMKDCPQYRLEFREGGLIGANAFALPGGIMVVTDEIVSLSKNDTEIIAVLAHELGHVKQRHAFRQSLQGVLSGLILAAVTGDVSSVGSGLPAVLMQMRYSREHETEADMFALNALQKACLPPKAFADILLRLQNQVEGNEEKPAKKPRPKQSTDSVAEILASHPDTQVRIKPFLDAKQNCS